MPSPTTRRRFLSACGVASLSAVAGRAGTGDGYDATADVAGDRSGWPTAGHDRANTNYVPGAPSIRGVARADRIDGRIGAARPVVADGSLYLTGETLRAFDVERGDRRWVVDPEEGQGNFLAAPTVAGDTVYLANGHQRVHAIGSADGERRWTTAIDVGSYVTPTLDWTARRCSSAATGT